jgi:hypothetical protein
MASEDRYRPEDSTKPGRFYGSGGEGEPIEPAPHAGPYGRGWGRDDEAIREGIQSRFTAHDMLDASDVRVEGHENEVTLRGTVTSEGVRTLAEDIAEGVSGVRRVHNELRAGGAGRSAA